MPVASPTLPRQERQFQEAVRLHVSGRQTEAQESYRALLRASPNHAPACNNLGTLLAQDGVLEEAQRLFERAIELEPDYGEAHNNLGLLLVSQGDHPAAVRAFERAVRLGPRNGAWQNNLGNALVEVFRFPDACAAYDRAVAADPGNADFWSNRGLALRGLREPALAIESLERALAIQPNHINALSNLGVLLKEERRFDDAVQMLRRAIDLAPDHVGLMTNLASIYERTGDHDEVRRWARRAVERDPDYPESYNLLANMEMEDGRYDEAETLYLDVVRRDPHNRNANWNLALIWLLRGDFARGWKQFEWRKRLQSVVFDHGDYGPSEWRGEDLGGRAILLHSEQGIGDAIQFVRYATLLKQRGAGRVVVECPFPLVSLLESARDVDGVVARGAPIPKYDVHANLMSLPALLGTTLATVPAQVPYLEVRPRPVAALVTAETERLTVGIVWTGNPVHARDYLRSAPLAPFLRFAECENVRCFSLQKGEAAECELTLAAAPSVVNLAPYLVDFRDTAAVIDALDLVITVDTSVAHLAGALGKETWLLLPHVPDFRWMVGRDDTPWYPTMRLFRQPAPRDWAPVFDAVGRELEVRAQTHRGARTPVAIAPAAGSTPAPWPSPMQEELVTFPSATLGSHGEPKFELWVPLRELAQPDWFDAYQAELLGPGAEREVRAFLNEVTTPRLTVLDIGPGLGLTSVDVCLGERPPSRLILVEPRDANWRRIESLLVALGRRPPEAASTLRGAADMIGDWPHVLVRVGDSERSDELADLVALEDARPLALMWPAVHPERIGRALDRVAEAGYRVMALGFADGEATLDAIEDESARQALVAVSPELWETLVARQAAGVEIVEPAEPQPRTRRLGIDWEVRGDTGWGVYGLNLSLSLLRRSEPVPELFTVDQASCSPLVRHALQPVAERALRRPALNSGLPFDGIMLRALGNNLAHGPLWNAIPARRNVGVVFLEDTALDDAAHARAHSLDLIVAGSSWNEGVLRAHGIGHVIAILQGIDPTVFHPAPGRRVLHDRFVVFSGGKLEYRKGQDIVVAAFRRFYASHNDAVLLTAWHNSWPQLIADLELAGHVTGNPSLAGQSIDVPAWCAVNGIPTRAVIDVGHQPNALMGQFVREADVALFPNRCEGGTNLVAMEAMACGIPTIVSANTGHLDLVATQGCIPLSTQRPVPPPTRFFRGTEGWGESDVEEIVALLERAYTSRGAFADTAQRGATTLATMSWERQCNKLLETIAHLW